jgi:uncharacterized protein with ATP-grasp and redox domains
MPPPPIRTDGSNWFAANTMRVRVPNIIRETQKLNNFPMPIHTALDRLRTSIENDAPIHPLPVFAPDYDLWLEAFAAHEGDTWLNSEWFFAEVYFYRLLIGVVEWHATGHDPFAAKKEEEITGSGIQAAIRHALSALPETRTRDLLYAALWGNRVDLSYAVGTTHGTPTDSDLLVDDSAAVVDYLLGSEPGHIHVVLDNAGTELALDLLLVDALLDTTEHLTLHVKEHPTFVSDATRVDVLEFLNEMAMRGSLTRGFGQEAREAGERLQAALMDGRLHITPDRWWNSPYFQRQMPPRLQWQFEDAALVIFKGDANYRRLLGDALWQPDTPFADAVNYFPAPLLALRTGKSDTIVGLRPGLAETLDLAQNDWRFNGRHGVIQFYRP